MDVIGAGIAVAAAVVFAVLGLRRAGHPHLPRWAWWAAAGVELASGGLFLAGLPALGHALPWVFVAGLFVAAARTTRQARRIRAEAARLREQNRRQAQAMLDRMARIGEST